MPTFLLTWNPARWNWGDFAAEARVLKRGEKFSGYWSCGNSTRIHKGDRVFLMKQGPKPRGIVAAGWVTSEKPYEAEHWEKEKRKTRKVARYVDIDFEAILDPSREAILGVDDLAEGPLATVRWGTQMGGIRIADAAAAVLEKRWRNHVKGRSGDRASRSDIVRDGDADFSPTADAQEAALLQRITVNPRIFGGKPIVRGRRLAVEHVLALLAAGDTAKEVIENYPWLEEADVKACLIYARRVVGRERIEPLQFESGQ